MSEQTVQPEDVTVEDQAPEANPTAEELTKDSASESQPEEVVESAEPQAGEDSPEATEPDATPETELVDETEGDEGQDIFVSARI